MSERVLISGPPASGKSALATQYAEAMGGATIIDFDVIAHQLGSPSHHDHPQRVRLAVHREIERRIDELDGPAVVIRGAPRRADREALAERIGADMVVVLDVDAAEAKERAAQDRRPEWTARAIDRWWSNYEPSPDDVTIGPTSSNPDTGEEPMTEATPDTGTEASEPEAPDTGKPVSEMSVEQRLDFEIAKNRKLEDKLRGKSEDPEQSVPALRKARDKALREIEELRRSQMTEQEAALDKVRSETESQVRAQFGGRLASEAVRAAAAGRVADVDALLEGIDPTRFLGDDGEPDRDAINGWVDRISPHAEEQDDLVRTLDLGQGARGATPTTVDPLQKALEKISHR